MKAAPVLEPPAPTAEDVRAAAPEPAVLCYRCEYRAQFHEKGHAPRCECGDVKSAVCSCYMYRPVSPVVLAKNEGDDRPQFAGSMFSARSHAVRVARCDLRVRDYADGRCLFVTPKNTKAPSNPAGGPDKRWRGKE